jgi:hypothetical protein
LQNKNRFREKLRKENVVRGGQVHVKLEESPVVMRARPMTEPEHRELEEQVRACPCFPIVWELNYLPSYYQ